MSYGNSDLSLSLVDQEKIQKYQTIANLYKPAVSCSAIIGNSVLYTATMGSALNALLDAYTKESVFTQASATPTAPAAPAATSTPVAESNKSAQASKQTQTPAAPVSTPTASATPATPAPAAAAVKKTATVAENEAEANSSESKKIDEATRKELDALYSRIMNIEADEKVKKGFEYNAESYMIKYAKDIESKLTPEQLYEFRASSEAYQTYAVAHAKQGSTLYIANAKLKTLEGLGDKAGCAGMGTVEANQKFVKEIATGKTEYELTQEIEKLDKEIKTLEAKDKEMREKHKRGLGLFDSMRLPIARKQKAAKEKELANLY